MFCILIVLSRKFERFIPGNGATVDVMCGIWATASRGVKAGKESVP